ncbi:hypothetical protein B0O99DRAFT_273481 [Bisporella sp. PMI_857]|nr:hypothetical protein B0O99DRAFT_273481 [Bisporella sp. PMI_857]
MSAIPVSVKSRISTDNESGDPLLVGQANGADAGSANSIPIESTTDIDVEWIFICQQEHTFTEQRALPDHAITAARMAYKFGDPSSETLYFFDVLRELRDKPSIRDKLSEFSRKSCIGCSKHADEVHLRSPLERFTPSMNAHMGALDLDVSHLLYTPALAPSCSGSCPAHLP